MNYSTGCAFNFSDLLHNFPWKKLELTCELTKQLVNDNHRVLAVRAIFFYSLKLILNDIIENNSTFWLPLTGNKKAKIQIRKIDGEQFKRLRRGGKWKDLDFLATNFCGFQMSFYMYGYRTPRIKNVYLSPLYLNRITEKANLGFAFGDGVRDTTIKDYYTKVAEMFPSVSIKDIQLILVYCWKSIYLHNSYGGDTLISSKDLWCYIGNLKKNSLSHFYYYIKKLIVKLRVLYKRKKIEWDGYYYFALSNVQYLNYLNQKHKRGRPKKKFDFGNVCLYLILDECKIHEHYKCYIFRVPYISSIGLKRVVYDFSSDRTELIAIREPLKFKDILVCENEYEFI